MNHEDIYELEQLIKKLEEIRDSETKVGSLNIAKSIYTLSKCIKEINSELTSINSRLRKLEGFHDSD